MWIYYLIPVVIHLIFLPLLFLDKNGEIMLMENFVGAIAVPIYLAIVSYKILCHFGMNKFLPMLLIILVVTILGIVISYFNWGIITGNLLKPDSETIHIMNWQMIIASIIVIISWTVVYKSSCIGYQAIGTLKSDEIIEGITVCYKEDESYRKYNSLSKYNVDFDKECLLLTSYKVERVVKSGGFIKIYVNSAPPNNINVYLLNRPNLYFDDKDPVTYYVMEND